MATIEVSDVQQLKIDDEQIGRWIGNRLNDARNRFLMQMSRGGGEGRVYRHGKKVFHIASLPFEYPLSDSGRLVGSVHSTLDSPRQGSIWSNLHYADYLAYGTEHMAPRLMLDAALDAALNQRPETDELAKAARIE